MAITFGGLATGMDTNSIVEALMGIERAPIDRLESDQAFYKSRLKAFSDLEAKLTSFREAAEAIDSVSELSSPGLKPVLKITFRYLLIPRRESAPIK